MSDVFHLNFVSSIEGIFALNLDLTPLWEIGEVAFTQRPDRSKTLTLAGRLPESSDTPAMLADRLPGNSSRSSPPVSSVFPPYPQCSINPCRSVSFRRLLLPKETASAGSCAGLLQSNYATSYLSKHHANHPCRR